MLEVKPSIPNEAYPRWRFRCYGDLEEVTPLRDWVVERFPYPPTKKKIGVEVAKYREVLHSPIMEVYSYPAKRYKYTVSFRDPEPAMLFKLTFGGK